MAWHTPASRWSASAFFFFNDTAPTEIYTLSLHDALPISLLEIQWHMEMGRPGNCCRRRRRRDRKSTRLNSSHYNISYAVFCLKKKKRQHGRHCGTAHCIPYTRDRGVELCVPRVTDSPWGPRASTRVHQFLDFFFFFFNGCAPPEI